MSPLSLHNMMNQTTKVEMSNAEWKNKYYDPFLNALAHRAETAQRSGLKVVDDDTLVAKDGTTYDDYFSPFFNDSRIAPLDVDGVSNVVIEARTVSKITKMPTEELLQKLKSLYD